MAGYVYRFRERKGVSYTVEQPASVAFEIHLLRVSDGALVWRGSFDKDAEFTDGGSASVCLVFSGEGEVGHGGGADRRGVEQVLKTFPGLP